MPNTHPSFELSTAMPSLFAWADALGHSLGRGLARGLNSALADAHLGASPAVKRGPGRPPKAFFGTVPAAQRCKSPGCVRPSRSKGLCSAHYQAARRRKLAKA